MRSSNDDAIAAAKYIETLARDFTMLDEQFKTETREYQQNSERLQAELHHLLLLQKNCMRAARGEHIKDVPEGHSPNYSTLPQSHWPDEVKEIYALRQRAIERDNAMVEAKMSQDGAEAWQKRHIDLLKLLERAMIPASGLLRSTRRAIARILERHNKANGQ
jgi:hypothetical protein